MAVMKVRCPECDTSIRQTIDPVDEPTEIPITCPRCQTEFASIAEPPTEQAPKKETQKSSPKIAQKPPAKGEKPSRRRDDEDDEDDDDDTPRSRRKKEQASGSNMFLIAGVGGGLLLVGGIVAAVLLLGGDKKEKEVAKNDDPAAAKGAPDGGTPPVVPPPGPTPGPGKNPGKTPGKTPGKNPGGSGPLQTDNTPPKPNPGGNPSPNPFPGPESGGGGGSGFPAPSAGGSGGTVTQPGGSGGGINPGDPGLPPPPVIRISGTPAGTAGKIETAIEKPPPIPPLAQDEDPFERAKTFRLTGTPPPLPKLPPIGQRPILTLDSGGHTAFVLNVFITPDSQRVITVGEDKAVRIWDLQTGTAERTIRLPAGQGDEGSLHAAALTPDGKVLAVGGTPLKAAATAGRAPVFLIDIDKGSLIRTLQVVGNEIRCMDFDGEGRKLAVGCADGGIHWFDSKTGTLLGGAKAHDSVVREIRYQRQGNMLGTIGLDSIVRVWDATTTKAKSLGQLDVLGMRPTTLAWSNDGQLVAVGGMTGEIRMYSSQNAQLVRTLRPKMHGGREIDVRRMKFLPGDREIVHCGASGGPEIGWAGIVNSQTGAIRCQFLKHTNVVFTVNISDDAKYVVSSGGNENETYVWAASNQQPISRLSGDGKGVWGVGWARDGKSIAWGTSNKLGEDGNSPLQSVFKLNEFSISTKISATAYLQEVTTDGGLKIEHDRGRVLALVPPTGRLVGVDVGDKIYGATLLPGKPLVAVACARSLQLYDARTGQKLREHVGHTGNVLSIAPSPDGRYFVTGSSDQTMRVWMPEFDDPVLSIFVAGRDWIAWTAGGIYTCSAQGERLVAWQVNGVGARFPAVHPAERFRATLYQPALIKYLVPTGDMRAAMAMAKKFDNASLKAHSIADALPPEVTLPDLAEDGKVIDQDKFVVKATATGKIPITTMRLLVDGRPFQGAAGVKRLAKPSENAEVSWEVPLTPGPHTFAVVADTGLSKGMSRVATLTRSGTPPKPNLYVIAVGVSVYPKGISSLRYAASDAYLLKDAFEKYSRDVFGKVHVRTLTDGEATRKNILDAMDYLKQNMEPKDVGVVSFSGHGMRDDNGKFFLVTGDVNPKDPEGTCLSGDEFKNRLENLPGRLVAILDACHSGAVAEKDKLHESGQAENLVRELVSEDSGVIVMCASLGREYSLESPKTKAGFYTLALVEGMREYGDVDQDGIVYINELDMYASARVAQLSGGAQTPTIGRPPTIRPFPIASTGKKPAVEKQPDGKK